MLQIRFNKSPHCAAMVQAHQHHVPHHMNARLSACLVAAVATITGSTLLYAEETLSEAPAGEAAETVEATTDEIPTDDAATEEPRPEDIDWSALATPLTVPSASGTPRTSGPKVTTSVAAWSRTDRPNGIAAVSVNRPVSDFWDMKAGANLDVARLPSPLQAPDTLTERLGGKPPQSQGTAWMSAKAPGVPYLSDHVALEARMDPLHDDARVGTAFSKTVPLWGEQYALTLRHGFSAGRSFDMDRSAQVSINDTGTSLLAGQSLAPGGERWLNSVGAAQQLFGGFSITGSVRETAEGASSASLTAGFKTSW